MYGKRVATKDQQVKHVVEGLALGVLALDVAAVTSNKAKLESAFTFAWNRWERAIEFPSLAGVRAANYIWIGMGRSEARQGTKAYWASDRWSWPVLRPGHWTLEERLDDHEDPRALARDWVELARLFTSRFRDEELRRESDA